MLKRWLVRILLAATILYSLVLAGFYLAQERIMLQPEYAERTHLIKEAGRYGFREWQDARGRFLGWHRDGSGTAGPVLVLHGSGGDALGSRVLSDLFPGAEVFLLEYPGYGARPGEANLASMVDVTVEALDVIGAPVTVLSYSLGTGIAAEAASKRKHLIRGMLLVAPFDRLSNVARHFYPFLPRSVVKHDLDSVAALRYARFPVAVILAGADQEIPVEYGRRLHEGYAGPKRLWVLEGAAHDHIDLAPPNPVGMAAARFLTGQAASVVTPW